MAINYWEQGGQLESYNPLPASVYATLPLNIDYVLTFKAKSAKSASLRVTSYSVVNDMHQPTIPLTPEFQSFSYSWKETEGGRVYFQDLASVGDIVVQDIKIVEKPTGKTTINGIDGFLSGKWTLHTQAKIIDNETLELNATNTFQGTTVWIDVEPNTIYTLLYEQKNGQYIYSHGWDKNQVKVQDVVFTTNGSGNDGLVPKTFTTGPATYKLNLVLLNSAATGNFLFKRPVLNLGSIPAPYEPKRGERMVLPVRAGKNLFNPAMWVLSGLSGTTGLPTGSTTNLLNYALVKSDVDYTVKLPSGYTLVGIYQYGPGRTFISRVLYTDNARTFKTVPTATEIGITVARDDLGVIQISEMADSTPQFEEGPTATPFEPYRLQMARKANLIPKKNLFDKRTVLIDKYVMHPNGTMPTHTSWNASDKIDVVPGENYIISGRNGAMGSNPGNAFYTSNDTYISGTQSTSLVAPANAAYMRVTIPKEDMETFQVERGTVATVYEPFELAPRKADRKPKNFVQKSDFKEMSDTTPGLAKPLVQYGTGGYSISDDVYIPNTKSQRIQWTSPANNGVGMLNRGLRVTLPDPEFSDLVIGELYTLSFYGKGWEDKAAGMGWYSVNLSNTLPLTTQNIGNGWYRYSYRFRFTQKEGAYIYVRPNNNLDYSYDCLMNGLQIEMHNPVDVTPIKYEPYKPLGRPARKGLEFGKGVSDRIDCGTMDFSNSSFEVETRLKFNDLTSVTHPIVSATTYNTGIMLSQYGKNLYVYIGSSVLAYSFIDFFETNRLYDIKVVFDKNALSIECYRNGVLVSPSTTNAPNILPGSVVSQKMWVGGSPGFTTGIDAEMHYFKMKKNGVIAIDFNFAKPSNNLGATFKGENGLNGVITGNPLQLNRQARR